MTTTGIGGASSLNSAQEPMELNGTHPHAWQAARRFIDTVLAKTSWIALIGTEGSPL